MEARVSKDLNLFGLLITFCFLASVGRSEQWNRHLILDSEGKYHVRWFFDDDSITFQVEVATRGWVGFGISPNGGMKGSDVVIGWRKNGKPIFHDRFAEGLQMPVIDVKQDWHLLFSDENATHTTLRFNRSLNTCDDKDLPITEGTTRLIYAYHPEDPASADGVMYHGATRRGTKSVLLLKTEMDKKNWTDLNLKYFDAFARNAHIPSKETTYYCTFIKAPTLEKKNHIVRMEPIIQPGNERFVHHMILTKCNGVSDSELQPYLQDDYHNCYEDNQIPKFLFCSNVITGWAVGAGPMDLPENVGMDIGEPGTSYYMLETHYDNPDLTTGVVDSSGLRLVYTNQLRPYDSATMLLGSMWYPCMFIPPRQKEFVVTGHSHSSCLKNLPKDGIKVFGVLLHSHLLGRQLTLRHFRGDEELPPIASDKSYDFNFQEFRPLHKERIILPNDHLITECTFDSSSRSEATFGGLGTSQEMCLSILFYYPKTSLAVSLSCPSHHNLVEALGVTEISFDGQFIISPATDRNMSYTDFLRTYPWDSSSLSAVQEALKHSPHLNFCGGITGKLKSLSKTAKYPYVKKYYTVHDVCEEEDRIEG